MDKKTNWRIVSLTHDYSSNKIQRHFNKRISDLEKAAVSIPIIMDRKDLAHEIASNVGYSEKKTLGLYGSGTYHHITYGLCRIAKSLSDGFTYIHIDHHNDSDYNPSELSCDSFVKNIVQDGFAKNFILVGSFHPQASTYVNDFDFRKYPQEIMPKILKQVKTNDVYLSIDLDVMADDEVSTSMLYSRGVMKKKTLIDLIEGIKSEKRIISADILGYTWSPFPSMNSKSKELYEDISKLILGEEEWKLHLR